MADCVCVEVMASGLQTPLQTTYLKSTRELRASRQVLLISKCYPQQSEEEPAEIQRTITCCPSFLSGCRHRSQEELSHQLSPSPYTEHRGAEPHRMSSWCLEGRSVLEEVADTWHITHLPGPSAPCRPSVPSMPVCRSGRAA